LSRRSVGAELPGSLVQDPITTCVPEPLPFSFSCVSMGTEMAGLELAG
jgi:hypothetical protein